MVSTTTGAAPSTPQPGESSDRGGDLGLTDHRRRDIRTFTCLGSALRILAINVRILPLRFAIFCHWCDFLHQV